MDLFTEMLQFVLRCGLCLKDIGHCWNEYNIHNLKIVVSGFYYIFWTLIRVILRNAGEVYIFCNVSIYQLWNKQGCNIKQLCYSSIH